MRLYLAGKMSGVPQFNFPAFHAAAADLRARGYDIVSPAELDEKETADAAMASKDGSPQDAHRSWIDYLARDLKIVADDVEGIMFLDGWEKSRGAKLEAFTALLHPTHKFFHYEGPNKSPSPMPAYIILNAITGNMGIY